MSKNIKQWALLSLSTFLLLILIHLALPALFLLLNVPSFAIGHSVFWILRWENTSARTGIQFNLTFLLAIAAVIGLLMLLVQRRKQGE